MQSGAGVHGVPRTAAELAALEASYQPFASADDWCLLHVDVPRLARYLAAVARERQRATAPAGGALAAGGRFLGFGPFAEVQDRLIRVAVLESAALDDLLPAGPQPVSVVLGTAIAAPEDAADAAIDLVAECHRRAMVLAGEVAADGRPVDINLIAVLQDMITESQVSYTVTTEHGQNVEVDLPKWQYKPVSNYLRLPDGGLAAFAPADMVAAEMDRLAGELGSPAFADAHPVIQAAYAHYALTAIHPFADGNGRLARTVASVYLIRAYGVPLLVFADQWPGYYAALLDATQGRQPQRLADYFSSATMLALDLATSLLAPQALAPQPPGPTVRPSARSELDERAEAACGLLDALAAELRQSLALPRGAVKVALTRSAHDAGRPEPAYLAVGEQGIRVAIGAGSRQADLEFVALISQLPGDLLPVAIRETHSAALFEAALADTCPLVLESTAVRAGLWARRLLAQAWDR
jgi:hypothetical protein